MTHASRFYFVFVSVLLAGLIGIFLSGCAVSGCGNPASNSTMSDSNDNVGSFNDQPIHIEQKAERLPRGSMASRDTRPKRIKALN